MVENLESVTKNPVKPIFYTKEQEEFYLSPPPFTIKELRSAIPAHCFERSLIQSFSHLFIDLIEVVILFYLASWISYLPFWGAFFVWPIYWIIQGTVMTGVWVIGHECGHQAFSDYKSVNDSVGWVLHSLLLVPYHSWRISHGQHHKNTSHCERDQVFVPALKENTTHFLNDIPVVSFFMLIVMWTVGWPAYLVLNIASQPNETRVNHFEPSSVLFKPNQRTDVLISNFGLLLSLSLFAWISYTFTFTTFIQIYFVPYLFVNFWLVSITYLQHTDIRVPHYKGEEWNFIRGALSTVDRNYGILTHFFHNIGDSHVAHHLFSQMPFYHAKEATENLKKVLGKYYIYDDTPLPKAIWKCWSTCHFINPEDGDILFYANNKSLKQK